MKRQVLEFDGVNDSIDHINVANLPTGGHSLSMFAWIKTPRKTRQTIFSYGTTSNKRCASMNVGQTVAEVFQPDFFNDYLSSGRPVADDRWHHVGFTHTGGTEITVYVDGLGSNHQLPTPPDIAQVSVGHSGCWLDRTFFFQGKIMEVSVWNRALTAVEVERFENHPLDPNEKGLVGYWPLNGNIDDLTSNEQHGILNGGQYREEEIDFLEPFAPKIEIVSIKAHGDVKRVQSDEYVEISNSGNVAANLGGWKLLSSGMSLGREQGYVFPNESILQPGGRFRVYTNQIHEETGGFSFGSKTAIWNDKGDTATLYDLEGTLKATYEYGESS